MLSAAFHASAAAGSVPLLLVWRGWEVGTRYSLCPGAARACAWTVLDASLPLLPPLTLLLAVPATNPLLPPLPLPACRYDLVEEYCIGWLEDP